MSENSELHIQDFFGENKILQLEFDVALFGSHTHFVYIPAGKEAPIIVTGRPDNNGHLEVFRSEWLTTDVHTPRQNAQRIAVLDLHGQSAASVYASFKETASLINQKGLNYNFLEQNSNSVASTLVAAAGLGIQAADLPGGGVYRLGIGNTLFDELAGGPQAFALDGVPSLNRSTPTDNSGETFFPDWALVKFTDDGGYLAYDPGYSFSY